MKSITVRMFLIIVVAVGLLLTCSHYYGGEIKEDRNIILVEIERSMDEPIISHNDTLIINEVYDIADTVIQEEVKVVAVEEKIVYNPAEGNVRVAVQLPVMYEEELVEEVIVSLTKPTTPDVIETAEQEPELIIDDTPRVVHFDVEEPVIKEIVVDAPINTKRLSIVLTDISNENIDSVINYLGDNKYIGLAFPYGNYDAMKKARDAGFTEIIASVVMEPFNESIALPDTAITTVKTNEENLAALKTVLNTTYMPIAITNKMGSKVTSKTYADTLFPIMEELEARQLGFIDSKSNYHSVAYEVAGEYNIANAENYTFIDKDASSDTIVFDSLDKLKEQADYKHIVLGMGDYSARMIRVLDTWLSAVDKDPGYEIVPVSVLMK